MRAPRPIAALVAVALVYALAACGGGARPGDEVGSGAGEAGSPADTAGPGDAPVGDGADRPVADSSAPAGSDTAPAGSGAPSPGPEAGPDTARFVPPPSAGEREWTAGIVRTRPAAGRETALLRSVRAARHGAYDRVVWEFSGGRPGVHVEYVDEPVRACGSGRPVPLPGDGWLEVRFEPAAAHDEAGRTFGPDRLVPDLPVVLEVVSTCDFEAVVAWVLGVAAPEPYRVTLLDDPARVAVDVRHRDAGKPR